MLTKTPPPVQPVNRRYRLNGCVAALPMLVAEEAAFFDKKTLDLQRLKQRQAKIDSLVDGYTSNKER